MDISPELTQWAQAHVFDFMWIIGGTIAFFCFRAAWKASR